MTLGCGTLSARQSRECRTRRGGAVQLGPAELALGAFARDAPRFFPVRMVGMAPASKNERVRAIRKRIAGGYDQMIAWE